MSEKSVNPLRSRFRFFLLFYAAVLILGTALVAHFEQLTVLDALYFSIVTIATVGFGDIHPITVAGKITVIIMIITGVGTFLGVVANATEMMLNRRELRSRMQKLNMVIEVFFSEAGKTLLSTCSGADPAVEELRSALIIRSTWKDDDFASVQKVVHAHPYAVDMSRVPLRKLKEFLVEKRGFLVRMLENPALLEHESFTDLLMAVFHLTEELASREDVEHLPATDLQHIAGDIQRAYRHLTAEWLDYMVYLSGNYPYLFSLAVRTNPFDRDASAVVRQ